MFSKITPDILRLVELIRPKLVQDGIFLVGLYIVGNKLLEVNVLTPGGLWSACQLEDTDFTIPIIKALEEKVIYRNTYNRFLSNKIIATL